MELKAVDAIAVAKRLVSARRRRCEVDRALRDVERIAVPLEDLLGGAKVGQQRILPPGLRDRDVVPADLLYRVRAHRCAQRLGDKLRTEADAEGRDAPLDRISNHAHLGLEVGVGVGLIDAHRSAEDREPVVAVQARLRVCAAAEVHVAIPEPVAPQQRIQCPEDLPGHVLKDEKLRHYARSSEGPHSAMSGRTAGSAPQHRLDPAPQLLWRRRWGETLDLMAIA